MTIKTFIINYDTNSTYFQDKNGLDMFIWAAPELSLESAGDNSSEADILKMLDRGVTAKGLVSLRAAGII